MKSTQLLALSGMLLLVTAFAPARATTPQSRGRGLSTREFDTSAPAEAQTGEQAGEGAPCTGGSGQIMMVDPLLMRPDPHDPRPAPRVPPPCVPVSAPAWYLEIFGFEHLVVSDSHGNTDRLYTERAALQTVRGVTYHSVCTASNCVSVVMSTKEGYTFKFKPDGPMNVRLVRGVGNMRPDVAVRYRDLNLPKGTWALLNITRLGPEDLRVDKDGDGHFETTVRPTASVSGPAALDLRGPDIEFSASALDSGSVLLTIEASDPSGVSNVLYSFDGRKFRRYDGPFQVDVSRVPAVHAFADDKVGNRSGISVYRPGQKSPRRAP